MEWMGRPSDGWSGLRFSSNPCAYCRDRQSGRPTHSAERVCLRTQTTFNVGGAWANPRPGRLEWRTDRERVRTSDALIVSAKRLPPNVSFRVFVAFRYTKSLWRTDRDSNPGDGHPPTHFPGVRLRPLGHLSVGCEIANRAACCKGLEDPKARCERQVVRDLLFEALPTHARMGAVGVHCPM